MSGDVVVITIPFAIHSLNVTSRRRSVHAKADLEKKLVGNIMAALRGLRPDRPFERARVDVVRFSPGELDQDNLYGACKALLDVLVAPQVSAPKRGGGLPRVLHKRGLGFLRDDKPALCTLVATQRKCRRDEARTVVTITELPPAAP
jgi:hypothetical protein